MTDVLLFSSTTIFVIGIHPDAFSGWRNGIRCVGATIENVAFLTYDNGRLGVAVTGGVKRPLSEKNYSNLQVSGGHAHCPENSSKVVE